MSSKVEEDPSGMDQHLPGAKLDKNKPRVDLMLCGFNRALLAVAEVTTYGANKYSPHGWMDVSDARQRKGEFSREEIKAMKHQQMMTYERKKNPNVMWDKLLDGQTFANYIMKKLVIQP